MVEGLLVLLLCQVVGTMLAGWLHLELPGAVLGMLLLLAMLHIIASNKSGSCGNLA